MPSVNVILRGVSDLSVEITKCKHKEVCPLYRGRKRFFSKLTHFVNHRQTLSCSNGVWLPFFVPKICL